MDEAISAACLRLGRRPERSGGVVSGGTVFCPGSISIGLGSGFQTDACERFHSNDNENFWSMFAGLLSRSGSRTGLRAARRDIGPDRNSVDFAEGERPHV